MSQTLSSNLSNFYFCIFRRIFPIKSYLLLLDTSVSECYRISNDVFVRSIVGNTIANHTYPNII